MPRTSTRVFERFVELMDEECSRYSAPIGELAERCELTPMEVGKAVRNPDTVARMAALGVDLALQDDDGCLVVTFTPR